MIRKLMTTFFSLCNMFRLITRLNHTTVEPPNSGHLRIAATSR